MKKQIPVTDIRRQRIDLETETHSLYIAERNRRVHLTQTEYRIFQALYQERLLSDDQLAKKIFEYSEDKSVRECLDKHIDHIRGKIRVYGWDIWRVLRYGYIVLPHEI